MFMLVLFDDANISLVGYRLMVPKADGSANHFDTKTLFEHVTEELGPSVQSLRMPLLVLVQDTFEPSGTASKGQVLSCFIVDVTRPLHSKSPVLIDERDRDVSATIGQNGSGAI
jgi:hypothetical protein